MPDRPEPSLRGATSALRQPRRNVLADDVYDILRDGLISRRIEPGSRLNLDLLARELHVSNTPVRQALARLESEGLVTKEAYRGFAASRLLDSRTIVELYEYRLMVEPPTAARAAQRRSDEGAADLEEMCDPKTVKKLLKAPPADSELPQRDVDFHLCIARQATNSVVVENLDQTLTRMVLYSGYGQSGAPAEAWEEHVLIARAIRAADPDAAALAMRQHLTAGLGRIRQAFG
jgi:DNA-binding GntR family transcriptional regulator